MDDKWLIQTTDTFDRWFDNLSDINREDVLASLLLLEEKGPHLSRPHADTVNDSAYRNMKELRVQSEGRPLRVFFAFDSARTGILLCAGDKTGKDKRFYKTMMPVADQEFAAHLKNLKQPR